MRVAILYEASGRTRDAFVRHGHDAISVDRRPCHGDPGQHAQAEVFDWLCSNEARGGG